MLNMTQRQRTANRIVEIQETLTGSPKISREYRNILIEEQRRLWDENHKGRAFDEICHDVWRVKAGY